MQSTLESAVVVPSWHNYRERTRGTSAEQADTHTAVSRSQAPGSFQQQGQPTEAPAITNTDTLGMVLTISTGAAIGKSVLPCLLLIFFDISV